MAIASMQLKNFKCFEDSGSIPLRPLTVIFGRNNTGKSSILQSLLLLRQTLESPEYGPRLDLRGPYYAAGVYRDIVHLHESSRTMEMSFQVEAEQGSTRFVMKFSGDEPNPPRLARLTMLSDDAARLEIRRSRGRGGPYEMFIAGKSRGLEAEANFAFPLKRFFPLIGDEPPRRGRPNQQYQDARNHAAEAIATFERSLMDMRAVGAFRRPPERRYEYRGQVPDAIDADGLRVIEALIEDVNRRGKRKGELFNSVNEWLKRVGRVRLMPLERISDAARLYEVRLRDTDSGRWANFADVGFGIGQALPVFVEGLRTPEGGTFVVQEPEIHLHPDAQLGMADFLVSLARSGRRVIVETHSENLLLRVRRSVLAIGNRKPKLSPDEISIVHVSKKKSGTSHADLLELDDMAQVSNWPTGFMQEATDERIAIMDGILS